MSKLQGKLPEKKGKELNIYFNVSENSGVGYYRQWLPAKALRDSGLANVLISDFKWGEGDHIEPGHAELFDIAAWADIIVCGRRDQPQFYSQWGGIKEFFNIPIVVDTDDNVQYVRPSNPGYQGYHPGSEALTWNLYGLSKVFSAITTSTEDLKEFYAKHNPKAFVLPNNIDVPEWDKYPKKVHNDGFLRVGFIGSGAHSEGVNMVKKPIREIMEKHPNVRLVITAIYRSMFNDFPKELQDRIDPIPWFKLGDAKTDALTWSEGLKSLGLDIGLAPLADNMFNRAKSNLRWMEYSISGIPTIASPVKPYLCIKPGKDGLLAKERTEWLYAMELLIQDEKTRYNIRDGAEARIREEFNMVKNVGTWYNTYKEIHDKYHEFFGKKYQFTPAGKNKYLRKK